VSSVWYNGKLVKLPSKVELGCLDRMAQESGTPMERLAWHVVALAVVDALRGDAKAQAWLVSDEAIRWAAMAGFRTWPPEWLTTAIGIL
jgi:hypothetical protein